MTFFDPYVAILDTKRFELATLATTRPGAGRTASPRSSRRKTAPMSSRSAKRRSAATARASIGCTSAVSRGRRRPLPAGGKPGETLDVRWLGDVLASEARKDHAAGRRRPTDFGIVRPATSRASPRRRTPFRAERPGQRARGRAEQRPWPTATPFEAPIALNGVIAQAGRRRLLQVRRQEGPGVRRPRAAPARIRSPLDPVLNVYRIGGAGVGRQRRQRRARQLSALHRAGGRQVRDHVHDHLKQGGPDYVYRVEVTPVKPRLTHGPARAAASSSTSRSPCRRAIASAFLVNASRADFGGDLNLEFKDLPPGVTVETLPMPANRDDVPVLFTAAADAPLAGRAGRRHRPPRRSEPEDRRPPASRRTSLVRGQNNIEVWNQYTERMATAVTQEAPFRDRDRRAQGAAGARRLDEAEGRRHAQGGLQRADHRADALQPAGRRLVGLDRDSRGQDRGHHSADGQRRRRGAEVEDRRAGRRPRWATGRCTVVVATGQPGSRRAVRWPSTFNAAAVEQGQGDRRGDQGRQRTRTSKGRPRSNCSACRTKSRPSRARSPRTSTELVFPVKTTANSPAGRHKTRALPGHDHGQRRADHAHAGHRRVADRQAAAAQGRTSRAAAAPMPRRRGRRSEADAREATEPVGETAAGTRKSQSRRQTPAPERAK